MRKSILVSLTVVITNTWGFAANSWSEDALVGAWLAEADGVHAMSVITKTHASYLVVNNSRKPFVNDPPTEAEMADAYKAISAASLRFDPRPGGWTMEFINASDPALVGVKVNYAYEWLNEEKTLLQHWVLNENGKRTAETGISRKLQ